MEKERIAEAEEAAERQRLERLEQRKLESHQLLADQLKKDVMGEGERIGKEKKSVLYGIMALTTWQRSFRN